MTEISESIQKLGSYIKSEDYKGYDPYDILMSPVFKLPILKDNKFLRFGSQQIFRRIPFNVRGLLKIKKGLNPVTLGLCLQSYTYLSEVFGPQKNFYISEISKLQDGLIKSASKGFGGICWGYDFDWEARYAKFAAYSPTIVATGIITNALFENYKITGNQKSLSLLLESVNFLNDLNKTFEGDNFCFSYSPFDNQIVFNATMLGARMLSQVYSINGNESLKEEAIRTVLFVIKRQSENGAWAYSQGDSRNWTDNFHTGYVIECLFDYIGLTADEDIKENLNSAIEFYLKNFILSNGIVKYYSNSIYPIDSTAIAQSIITLSKVGFIDEANKIIKWAIANMQDEKGFFYYQKKKCYTNKISYMRWSNAWMFLALSLFLYKNKIR